MFTKNNQTISVLYLDTQLEFAKIFSRLLEKSSYTVTHYSNLEHLSKNCTVYDLILCDHKLFRHYLFSTLRTQQFHQKPCLVFASHLSNQDKLALHRHGIEYYFERIDNFKIILDKINSAIQQ
ncbi:MAG TPA: hypothetical protein PKC21_04355 [Oligoflexia bacterium]|nr:hypothetical protein [Oligoflexia bacterium]HMR24571.1 hypothetical protein [Oligoflexia bacterium]